MRVRGLAGGLALTVLLLGASAAASKPGGRYGVRELPTLGGAVSAAGDVNGLGQVVGVATTSRGFGHAFLWSKGKMRDLGTLGGPTSTATALNDRTAVVGNSTTAAGATHAFFWTSSGGMRDLGTLGGQNSFAADVNDLGVVVGRSADAAGTPHGFIWTAQRGMRALAGDPFSVAAAVGAGLDGPIGGSARLPFVPGGWGGAAAPFAPFPLPAGFDEGQTFGLNARGDAVGTISTAGGGTRGFFRRSGGSMLPLGGLGSEADAVSNSLRIVGRTQDAIGGMSAWLARSPTSAVRALAELVPGSGWTFAFAGAVNDLGQVAGTGVVAGKTRAYLLAPPLSEQAASVRGFVLGGRAFHRRVARALSKALADRSHGKRGRACKTLARLAASAGRERSLPNGARRIFATDVRGLSTSVCSGV